MNWGRIEGNWLQFKGSAKETRGERTNDQLDVVAGKRDRLAGLLQEHYGYAREAADRRIDDWMRGVRRSRQTWSVRLPDEPGAGHSPVVMIG